MQEAPLTVGIVGLGLIGGSLAKAYKAAGWKVYGVDANPSVTSFAELEGVLDGPLSQERYAGCALIHVALPPRAAESWMRENAPQIPPQVLLMDDCGTKREVTKLGFALAERFGFTYAGGHPMAGTHRSGYKYATATMFRGASMIIVPPRFDDPQLIERIKSLLAPLGLRKVAVTTADEHDRMIAFTSQLAHVVSNAYIKSPCAQVHKGFSAGSFRDLTRVAWLNEKMWSELFLENRDCLLGELDSLIARLQAYSEALRSGDEPSLEALLREGRIAKEQSEKEN